MVWFLVFLVIAAVPILLWNFVPSIRNRVRGWSTVLEAAMGGVVYTLGQATDGLKELQQAGYLPGWLIAYVPYVFLIWVVFKRVQTSTSLGSKK